MTKSIFTNVIRGEEEYLLHNTLHGTIIKAKCVLSKYLVDKLDQAQPFVFDESNRFHQSLIEQKMVVDESLDEVSLLNYRFSQLSDDKLQVILIVTRQCNLRCVYCYENHEDKRMGKEVYTNIINGIRKQVASKGYRSVVISLFGGEPMLEYEAICEFMNNVKNLSNEIGIDFFGQMTTNAYALTIDKLSNLVNLGVKYFQITLDGLKETHDASRCMVNGNGSWEKISRNLIHAKNSNVGFKITIRTNFDSKIISNIDEYLSFLSKNFTNDNRFLFHFEAVKKLGGKQDDTLNIDVNESSEWSKLINNTNQFGLKMHLYSATPFSYMCYASKVNHLVVDTDGTLMKCTICIDSEHNVVGKTSNIGFEIEDEKICNWVAFNLPKKCYDCSILALCFGRMCPGARNTQEKNEGGYCLTHNENYYSSMRKRFNVE